MLTVLEFMSAAHAQDFTLRVGTNLAPGFSFDINAELNAKNLVRFDSSLSLGLYGKLGLGFGGGGVTSFIFGFVSGVDYPVSPAVNLFAHPGLSVGPGFFGYIDFSADFAISRAIDACGKLPVGFSGTFGLGLGLRFGF